MPTYFKSLRRKLGIATLVMACLFTAGWVRSCFFDDGIRLVVGPSDRWKSIRIDSMDQQFGITTMNGFKSLPPPKKIQWETHPIETARSAWSNILYWKWRWLGFGVAANSLAGVETNATFIPYWSMVVPFILLSAWLLLSKPRVAKPTANSKQ